MFGIKHIESTQPMGVTSLLSTISRLELRERLFGLTSHQAHPGMQCRMENQERGLPSLEGEKEISGLAGVQRQCNRKSLGHRSTGGPADVGPGTLKTRISSLRSRDLESQGSGLPQGDLNGTSGSSRGHLGPAGAIWSSRNTGCS